MEARYTHTCNPWTLNWDSRLDLCSSFVSPLLSTLKVRSCCFQQLIALVSLCFTLFVVLGNNNNSCVLCCEPLPHNNIYHVRLNMKYETTIKAGTNVANSGDQSWNYINLKAAILLRASVSWTGAPVDNSRTHYHYWTKRTRQRKKMRAL